LRDKVYSMKVGDISFPKRLDLPTGDYGFHILKLKSRVPEHVANLEQDYQDIKRLAEFRKRENMYNKWVKDLRDKIYWEINI
jgi:peptidyl-prolyl cis-trans isomerase SurA